jgi:hypothetical protein
MSMYFSIYRIHTDKGTYVGQASNLVSRMIAHYSCKVWKQEYKKERLPICKAIRETPSDNLKIEELGYYSRFAPSMAAIGLILVRVCGYVEALPNPYRNTR